MMDRDKMWKIVKTVWLFWGFMMPGVGDAVLGPTLLDLQLLVNEEADMFSYLLLATGIGAITGSLLAGLICPSVNTMLKLAITILLGSLVNAITPAVPSYTYLLFMFGLQGLCRGFIACYLLEVCNTLWEHKGTAFQFIFCGATTGSILTPLIVRPFLCIISDIQPLDVTTVSLNNTGSDVSGECRASDTHVQFAYIVLGLLTMPSGIAFLYYWIRERQSADDKDISQYEDLSKDRNVNTAMTKLQLLYLTVLFFFYFPMLGNNMLYTTFLTAFGVDGPLHISKSSMVYMTSLFWGGFLVSRVGNTLLTPCCGNFKIILFNSICLLISGAFLISLATKYNTALWISTLLLGLFSGPFQGAALAWTANYIKIEPKVISISFLGVGAGAMALPFVGGMLYHYIPPAGHLYLVFSMTMFLFIMFLLLKGIGDRIKKESLLLGDEVKLDSSDSNDS